MRGLPVEPQATSSAPLWGNRTSEWHHQGIEECTHGDDSADLTFPSSWDAVRREAHFLREQLAAAVRTAESVVSTGLVHDSVNKGSLRIWLESARLDFLRFKKSRSAWQDIHTDDAALLANAKSLLDRLS
jgi:hypothetical protein